MLAMAQAMENIKMQLKAAGKDLAEQLEKGQAQMARQRLLDMMKKLQSSNLTPAEQSQMLSELRDALQPAGDYGEVGKWLKEAMNQLGSDQAWAASQSLEEAAQALEMGADAVLVNSAIALAGDPAAMAEAMGKAVMAGRTAHLSGRLPRREQASASSPTTGLVQSSP